MRCGSLLAGDLLIEMSQRLGAMRAQELSQYAVPDYLSGEWQRKLKEAMKADEEKHTAPSPSVFSWGDDAGDSGSASAVASASFSPVNESWRDKVCDWCYQVADHFDFNREVVAAAMSYLDRYLALRAVANRRTFELAAITALYLAIKLLEPGKPRVSSLIRLGSGRFTAEHIVAMEHSMLETLNWHVNPPTPIAFCRDLMHLVSADISPIVWNDVNELARFLMELSVFDYWFVTKRSSSIALASILNAMELQGHCRVHPKYKVHFLRSVLDIGIDIANDEEIVECYGRLQRMYAATGYSPRFAEGAAEESADFEKQPQQVVEEVAILPLIAM